MVRIRQKRPDPFVVSTPGTLRLFPCQSYAPPAETWVLVLERGVARRPAVVARRVMSMLAHSPLLLTDADIGHTPTNLRALVARAERDCREIRVVPRAVWRTWARGCTRITGWSLSSTRCCARPSPASAMLSGPFWPAP